MKTSTATLSLKFFVTLFCSSFIHAAEIVIHTGDSGTSSTGSWNAASGASMPIDGNRGLYANVGGEIETYHFSHVMPEETTYTLQVYNTCYTPRSHQVTQTLIHADGSNAFVTDQDCQTDPYVGSWRTLGSFDFQQGEHVEFIISTEGSDNRYVGASAIRYVYNEETPSNATPVLSLSTQSIEVAANSAFTITAKATDAEDGDLSAQIQWTSPNQSSTGNTFTGNSGSSNFSINVSVSDSEGASSQSTVAVNVANPTGSTRVYDFGCTAILTPTGLDTYNESALPDVGSSCGRYTAWVNNNDNNRTLFYHANQGRLDGTIVRFPFEAVLRNVGIAPPNSPEQAHQTNNSSAYNFIGLHIHHVDFNNINSTHLVVGQRGSTINTIEGKKTLDARSSVNDVGNDILPNGRADIRLVMDENGHVLAYWQLPNLTGDPANDSWTPYLGTGELPGPDPDWGDGNEVIVGIITYAYYSNGLPFWGVADSLEIIEN